MTGYTFKWEGGGEVAKELSGQYTSIKEAKDSVHHWQMAKFPSKRKKNTIEVVLDGEARN